MGDLLFSNRSLLRLVLERGYRKKSGMSGRHIAITTWLEALDLQQYLPLFSNHGGVEDLLYASETEIRDLGVKNGAHRAKIVSSLLILRQKYERGKSPAGNRVPSPQRSASPTSPTVPTSPVDYFPTAACSEALEQDLQRELNADPSELKSRAWYHGSISRQRAEALVPNSGDFLVRDSMSKPGEFVLSVGWRGMPLHFIINALVGDCAPGSLPSITFHFEEDSFGTIQELIHFYLTRHKTVTAASGAVLRNPVGRALPLSYYDSKYGCLQSGDTGDYHVLNTGSPSSPTTPLSTPPSSPGPSPDLNRWGAAWKGSQPVLSRGDVMGDHGRSSSLERFGSLPVINVIPPGGPGYVRRFQQRQHDVMPIPVGHQQRMGSDPFLVNENDGHETPPSSPVSPTPAGLTSNLSWSKPLSSSMQIHPAGSDGRLSPRSLANTGSDSNLSRSLPHSISPFFTSTGSGPGKSPSRSPAPIFRCLSMTPARSETNLPLARFLSLQPAGSEGNLCRRPPPKPVRVPSIKCKQRPKVDVRHHYDDDIQDDMDDHQLPGPSSWTEGFFHPHHAMDSPSPPLSPTLSKSRCYQGGGSGQMVSNNVNALHRGYHTLPLKSKTRRRSPWRESPPRVTSNTLSQYDNFNPENLSLEHFYPDNSCADDTAVFHSEDNEETTRNHGPFTLPELKPASRINVEDFQSCFFPDPDNRILDSMVLIKVKSLLLSSNARALAGHMTKVDLDILRVAGEDDLGLGVTSGIELCTLPQGDQVREDIIERWECQRLLVMTSLLTCPKVKDRVQVLGQWIQTADQLHVTMGNSFSFAAIMEALSSPQIRRLRDTWLVLRQDQTDMAFLYDTRLKPFFKTLHPQGPTPTSPTVLHHNHHTLTAVPYITPLARLLQSSLEDHCPSQQQQQQQHQDQQPHHNNQPHLQQQQQQHHHRRRLLLPFWESWESSQQELEVALNHLNNARTLAHQAHHYATAARRVLAMLNDHSQENIPDVTKENSGDMEETDMDMKQNVLETTENALGGFPGRAVVGHNVVEELEKSVAEMEGVMTEMQENDLEMQENGGDTQESLEEVTVEKQTTDVQENSAEESQENVAEVEENHVEERKENCRVRTEVEELCRTEFHLRLMWGSQGVGAPRGERVDKFHKLLSVLSERLESPADKGTEV